MLDGLTYLSSVAWIYLIGIDQSQPPIGSKPETMSPYHHITMGPTFNTRQFINATIDCVFGAFKFIC